MGRGEFGAVLRAVADRIPQDLPGEIELARDVAEQGRPDPDPDRRDPHRAGPAPQFLMGLGDVALPTAAGRVDALARGVAAAVVVESQRGHPLGRESAREALQYEVRAHVSWPMGGQISTASHASGADARRGIAPTPAPLSTP